MLDEARVEVDNRYEGAGVLLVRPSGVPLLDGERAVAAFGTDLPGALFLWVLTVALVTAADTALVWVCDGVGDECPRLLVVVEFIPLGDGEAEVTRGAGLRPIFGGVGCPSRYRG